MPKYNYKDDAMTAYMKGKISAKELDKISKEDFKSSVATKQELQNFLKSGYMKELMANTYGLKVPAMEKKVKELMRFAESMQFEGMFSTIDQIRQDSKDVRDFVKNVFADRDFKKMKNDKDFIKYLKSVYEGFASDAQRRAAFASGYKAKGKKKESISDHPKASWKDKDMDEKLDNDDIPVVKKIIDKLKGASKKHAQQADDLEKAVNEISAEGGLKRVIKGQTREVEGIKVSKEMAQAMLDWFNSSPYGRKYPKAKKGRLHISLGIMSSMGLDRYAKHKGAKKELQYIKDLARAMRDNVNEATIKGQNRKTGETFGMVIGSDKKNKEGNFELTIRVSYSSRISAYKLTFNSNNELISFLDYGYSMDGRPPDVTKSGGSGKSIRPDKRKTIVFIAKLTSPAFANKIYKHLQKVNESINEILVIVDKFDKKKQSYGKIYYKDGGNRPNDGDLKKANKELEKLSKKHKGLTLVSVGRNSKMYDVHNPRESVNEKRDPNLFYVLFQKKGVLGKPAAAGYKTRKDAEDFAKSLRNYNIMILNKQEMKHVKGIDIKEGKKRYNVMYGVGSSKYTVNFHDGKSKHKDGSDFFDIAIFKNKKDLAKKINDLTKQGYIYSYQEGVNESKTKESKVVQMIYKYAPKEKKFYDKMAEHERRIGQRDFKMFIARALRGFGINPNKYKSIPDAEEKLYQTVSQ